MKGFLSSVWKKTSAIKDSLQLPSPLRTMKKKGMERFFFVKIKSYRQHVKGSECVKFVTKVEEIDSGSRQVTWKSASFQFKQTIDLEPSTGAISSRFLRLSVRQEVKGGRKHKRVGIVDIDLAEFASSRSDRVTRQYLLQESPTNSILKVAIAMQQVSGDYLFSAPSRDDTASELDCDNEVLDDGLLDLMVRTEERHGHGDAPSDDGGEAASVSSSRHGHLGRPSSSHGMKPTTGGPSFIKHSRSLSQGSGTSGISQHSDVVPPSINSLHQRSTSSVSHASFASECAHDWLPDGPQITPQDHVPQPPIPTSPALSRNLSETLSRSRLDAGSVVDRLLKRFGVDEQGT